MSRDLKKEDKNGHLVVTGIKHDAWLKWNAIDLTGIRAVTMAIYAEQGVHEGGIIELRQGGAEGTLVGTGKSMPVSKPTAPVLITIPLQAVSGKQDIFVLFKNPGKPDKLIGVVDWIKFERWMITSVSFLQHYYILATKALSTKFLCVLVVL